MAGSALLEREIEKITGETQEEKERLESAEEYEHRQKMAENLRDIIERRVSYDTAPQEEYDRPVYRQYSDFTISEHAPVVPNSPQAPSASDRIADYLAANRNLEEMRARSDEQFSGGIKNDAFRRAFAQVYSNEYAEPVDEYEYYEPTEEEELYRQGILMNADFEPERERVQMPNFSPSYMMAEPVETEESDDARPTPQTMGLIERKPVEDTLEQQREDQIEDRAPMGLSAKTKVILAALAATIAVLIAIISINTAVLNSVRASIREREDTMTELSETLTGIESEISDLTSPENVENWASSHGMTPPNA